MNHPGMKYSLASRELIADSVEVVAQAHAFDALVLIPNCDKIIPGMLMAAARLNLPTIVVSGGPMLAGRLDGQAVDLADCLYGRGGGRPGRDGRVRAGSPGAGGLPRLWFLRRHVHRQHHELPDRGAGHGPARQRDHPGRPTRTRLALAKRPGCRSWSSWPATSSPWTS